MANRSFIVLIVAASQGQKGPLEVPLEGLGRIGGGSPGDQNRPLETILQVEKRPLNTFDFFPIRAIVVAILARLASSGE